MDYIGGAGGDSNDGEGNDGEGNDGDVPPSLPPAHTNTQILNCEPSPFPVTYKRRKHFQLEHKTTSDVCIVHQGANFAYRHRRC